MAEMGDGDEHMNERNDFQFFHTTTNFWIFCREMEQWRAKKEKTCPFSADSERKRARVLGIKLTSACRPTANSRRYTEATNVLHVLVR